MLQSILNNVSQAVEKLDIIEALQAGVDKALQKFQGLRKIFNYDVKVAATIQDDHNNKEKQQQLIAFYKRCTQLHELSGFISLERAHNMEDIFIIGLVLYNETQGDDLGLLFWQKFIRQGPFFPMLKQHLSSMYQDFSKTTTPLSYTTLIYFACNDNPNAFQLYCNSYIIKNPE